MKDLLFKHWLKIAGVLVGSLGGYLYYIYVGCVTGTCAITSNPYMSILYGSIMGYLLLSLFQKNPKRKTVKQEVEENKD